MIKHLLIGLFKEKKNYKIQSFTFYIPSPPARTTGYREKQFDKIFYEFINKGYDILDFKTVSSNGEKQSGMWAIFIVRALNESAESLNLDHYFHDNMKNSKSDSEIDGLYYIEDNDENL
jgi:hypothetical protein